MSTACLHINIKTNIASKNRKGKLRIPNVQEREVMMGMPKDYTINCQKASKGVKLTLTLAFVW